jgi:hypothetical protein
MFYVYFISGEIQEGFRGGGSSQREVHHFGKADRTSQG